jgi:uncharacterized Zn finger protein
MTIPGLSESFIRQNATAESFRRGQDYHRRQAVISLERDDDALEAQVQGSGHEPYQVRITFDRNGTLFAGSHSYGYEDLIAWLDEKYGIDA